MNAMNDAQTGDTIKCRSFEDYLNFVNNERVMNVQMLVNNILEEAESRRNSHQDDKTIIAFKVGIKV